MPRSTFNKLKYIKIAAPWLYDVSEQQLRTHSWVYNSKDLNYIVTESPCDEKPSLYCLFCSVSTEMSGYVESSLQLPHYV